VAIVKGANPNPYERLTLSLTLAIF
jgi:hypothetical protein